HSVFRASDVDRLAAELAIDAAEEAAEAEQAAAASEGPAPAPEGVGTGRGRRRDPIKLVSTRISMDSRWAEISEKDMATWLDALEPVQFDRVRKVSAYAIESLQRVLAMLDEQERRLGTNRSEE